MALLTVSQHAQDQDHETFYTCVYTSFVIFCIYYIRIHFFFTYFYVQYN